jgi:diketogulonate reductase-like aldo/keto reductase
MMEKTVSFGDRAAVPAIGQGTWYMGEDRARRTQEVAALRAGVERGLTVIDTAEMYAHGGAEEVVGEAIRGLRDRVMLVSKVYPWHAGGQKMMDACEASLRRLGTDYLDMYLLHWAGEFSFAKPLRAWRGWWRREKFAVGAYRISILPRCRRCGRLPVANGARPIRYCTTWRRGALNMTCWRGVSNGRCR